MSEIIESKGKKITFLTAGLIAIFAIMFFVVSNSKISASVNGARIAFTEIKHDFGKVKQGPQIDYTFRFKNKGNALLVIDKVQASCGCTGVTTGDKKEFQKNEEGEIKITFNTEGREGKQEKTVMVYSNDSKEPQKVLTFTAEIDPSLK